jgi:ubiquinone/menaquinone biosynthesis C-methylase UbiE
MDTRQAYNLWATQYDTNDNKTRDLEGLALRAMLGNIAFESCLEIGCGTGKNTGWLLNRSTSVTAVDLSDEMLTKAKQKVNSDRVAFIQADITAAWSFRSHSYDLVTFSLVLEHIENLGHIFDETSRALKSGGAVYVGELHPFKQYAGTKARFDTGNGIHVLECYNHHISDFMQQAKKHHLVPVDMNEYFDDNDRSTIPRILTLLFRKQ